MRSRRLALLLLAAQGCSGRASTDGAGSASPAVVTAPPSVSTATATDLRGAVRETSWSEIVRLFEQRRVCWVAPIASGRAYVTTCREGDRPASELRTTPPTAAALRAAVDAADPKHDAIGYTTSYEAYREVEWPEAAALFPTGTVYEVEVNQTLRVFMSTAGDDAAGDRLTTTAPTWREVQQLAAAAPRPRIVKLFQVEEVPWKRAVELFAAGRIRHAGHVHINRVFLTDASGAEYLTIPPDDAAVKAVQERTPTLSWTIE